MIYLQSPLIQIEILGDLYFQPLDLRKKTNASCQAKSDTRQVHFRRRRKSSNKCHMSEFLLTEKKALPLSHSPPGA